MGPHSTNVMPGIEMERAFSALASLVRLPSPLGWAGMMGAFGAPRFARAVAMPQDANSKCPNFSAGLGARLTGSQDGCRHNRTRTTYDRPRSQLCAFMPTPPESLLR